jgi:N-acetylmuramoyl-L-alanine amidase
MADCTSERFRSSPLSAALLGIALCAAGVCADQPASEVTAVRFWSVGDVTRVAIEVSSEFKYKWDRIQNPDRLFFDIQGARPSMVAKGIYTIPVGDGKIKQIRIAETQPGVTRVVLDLEGDLDYTASQLANPERLMVELRVKGQTTPSVEKSLTGVEKLNLPDAETASATTAPAKIAAPDPPVREAKPAEKTQTAKAGAAASNPAASNPVKSDPVKTESAKADPAQIDATDDAPVPEPAKRNSNGRRSLTRALGLKLSRVVIDPGHGGNDHGTHGPSGLLEKDLTLDIGKRLAALLEDRMGSEVVLTRTDDSYVALEDRTRIANDSKADLFLSIHANSSPVKSVRGVETYYLNFTTSRAELDLAARENATSQSSVFDLQDVLEKIATQDKVDESREFASRVQTALFAISKQNNAGKNRGVKKAPFVVLIGAHMPSVLAEIGFLTNATDEALMRKPEQRQKIAEALYKGIAAYADTLSHQVIAQTQ